MRARERRHQLSSEKCRNVVAVVAAAAAAEKKKRKKKDSKLTASTPPRRPSPRPAARRARIGEGAALSRSLQPLLLRRRLLGRKRERERVRSFVVSAEPWALFSGCSLFVPLLFAEASCFSFLLFPRAREKTPGKKRERWRSKLEVRRC